MNQSAAGLVSISGCPSSLIHFDADSAWEHVAAPGNGVTKQPDYDNACFCGKLTNPS